ncbi:hypothetical protein [Shewanella xiamenensis]|nr:hypothetical protein [Shewanella xiamenensis]MEE1980992.1 hypothetical protein [Shewanella xiamenensis]
MMNKSFAISMLTLALCATQAVADEHKFYGRIDYSVTNSGNPP